MSIDIINILAYLLMAFIAAIIIAGLVGLIKFIILWIEIQRWKNDRQI